MTTPDARIKRVTIRDSLITGQVSDSWAALVDSLQRTLGKDSRVLSRDQHLNPRTEPEGAANLELNEIIILFGSGAGMTVLQQVISLTVEWLKARRQATVSIEVDSLKITVSGETHPHRQVIELFDRLQNSSSRKQQSGQGSQEERADEEGKEHG